MKKLLGLLCAAVIIAGAVVIWSQTPGSAAQPLPSAQPQSPAPSNAPLAASGSVYYLNFKPEQASQWEDVAALYTRQTGVPVTVLTAASGTYEDTLRSEMEKSDPPTLFQVNGPTGLRTWRDWCLDLSGTAPVEHLQSPEFALRDGDEVLAVAYAIETYGLIFNRTLLNAYCAMDGAVIEKPEEIRSFATLKAVAEDIQAHKEELGVLGAFTSAGMDASSDWRFKTHLANLPIYYEYKDGNIQDSEAIQGTYLQQLRQVWDLYLQNATCDPGMIGARTGEDAASEFALGEAVFYQNGTWAYADCINEGLTDEDLGMLPIYIGAPGEENQGLCTGSENYWCINRRASQENIEATKAFLEWLITSEEGKNALGTEMGFVTPFDTFQETPQNALQQAAQAYLEEGKTPVSWAFLTIPSETWKNQVGAAMLEYAQGTGSWETVERAFVEGWAAESRAAD